MGVANLASALPIAPDKEATSLSSHDWVKLEVLDSMGQSSCIACNT